MNDPTGMIQGATLYCMAVPELRQFNSETSPSSLVFNTAIAHISSPRPVTVELIEMLQ
jgi:hypothetical protein